MSWIHSSLSMCVWTSITVMRFPWKMFCRSALFDRPPVESTLGSGTIYQSSRPRRRRSRRNVMPILLSRTAAAALLVLLVLAGRVPAADFAMQDYKLPEGIGPHDVAPAPDGGVWFTAQPHG